MRMPGGPVERYGALLIALLAVLFISMLFAEAHTAALRAGLSAVLLAGLFAAFSRGWIFWVGIVLFVPALLSLWASFVVESPAIAITRSATGAAFMLFTAAVVFAAVLREKRVGSDTIVGGVAVYLLIALAFTSLHTLAEVIRPGAYATQGVALSEWTVAQGHSGTQPSLLYFSLVTITTLGYGDIVPVSQPARFVAALEAVLGQMYVAIFIARLVAIHVGLSTREDR